MAPHDHATHAANLLRQLQFPWAEPPAPATSIEVAPGVRWLRMPLPFQLNHINLWLIADDGGWCVVDTGINLPATKELWERMFAGELAGQKIVRVIGTHMHPDHIGVAGWLCERWDAPLHMTLGDYLSTLQARSRVETEESDIGARFHRANGCDEERIASFRNHRGGFAKIVGPLPGSYVRLMEGEATVVGGRRFETIVGRGHAPEHASLYCAELGLMIAGDQVLPKITTNVGVWPNEPRSNPLQWFIDTMDKFRKLPPQTLVLPSHGLPFRGLHTRLRQLVDHHDERLNHLHGAVAAVGDAGVSGWESVRTLFAKHLDNHQAVFAFGETLAHLHCLEARGDVARRIDADGVHRFVAVRAPATPDESEELMVPIEAGPV